MEKIYDMLIIGGGPGGYTAALYAARSGLSVAVLEKLSAGGQMALTDRVENYPGFPEGIDGFTLAEQMQAGAEAAGAVTEYAEVTAVDLRKDPKEVHSSEGLFLGRTVVIATGADPRKLGLPGEAELTGRGVNYCAHCDGMFYKGKTVAVVGGGNSAVAEALYLSALCEKVYLIHRRDSLRATKVYEKALAEKENIEFILNTEVEALERDGRLTGLHLKEKTTGQAKLLPCDGLFISIGRVPASGLFRDQLATDESGFILAGESTATSIPGVYAAGDVRTKALRQIVTAVADGAMAVHSAEEYLHSRKV